MSEPIPEKFQTVIDTVLNHHDADFFTEGGCGVLAALMAEVAMQDREFGEFNLVMREDCDGDQWLSHITYWHYQSGLDIDIHGAEAEDRWLGKISEEAEEEGEDPSELIFFNVGIPVGPGTNIMDVLLDLTDRYDLNVREDWIEEHYPELRKTVLGAVGRQKRKSPDLTPG